MKTIAILIYVLFFLSLFSCNNNSQEAVARKIVTEWTGKQIILPDNIAPVIPVTDSTAYIPDTPYKILIYTDSIGCTSCKLGLPTWKFYIAEMDSLMPGVLSFHFYFRPKREKELEYLFKRDEFSYPVYIDTDDRLNKLNKLPSQMEFQCFLLDSDNKVLAIGNPVLNDRVWELYKQVIFGDKVVDKALLTTVQLDNNEIKLDNLEQNKTVIASFTLKNTGSQPLLIRHVATSCGCTVPSWEKRPIAPGHTTNIVVEVKPDASGYFRKTISVFCNVAEKNIPLTISGLSK